MNGPRRFQTVDTNKHLLRGIRVSFLELFIALLTASGTYSGFPKEENKVNKMTCYFNSHAVIMFDARRGLVSVSLRNCQGIVLCKMRQTNDQSHNMGCEHRAG
jgi:hypothetical protein